jgi:hypothetical protein
MLTRIRIEVEEATAAECVEALAKYEHAIQQQEARRYRELWPVSATLDTREGGESKISTPEEEYPTPDLAWAVALDKREFYGEQFGTETTDEVIEFDSSIPGYKGRRVVSFSRIDTRNESFPRIEPQFGYTFTGVGTASSSGVSALS